MIRCIRLWTGEDGNSHFEEGRIQLEHGATADLLSGKVPATTVSFQETPVGGTFEWHDAPVRQLVITLSGTLDFVTRGGQHFELAPGDVLLAGALGPMVGLTPGDRVEAFVGGIGTCSFTYAKG